MDQYQHKHYSPKVCLDCRKQTQKDIDKKYADRRNRTKWMNVWIGEN